MMLSVLPFGHNLLPEAKERRAIVESHPDTMIIHPVFGGEGRTNGQESGKLGSNVQISPFTTVTTVDIVVQKP
jgi:hypothetical protein